MNTGEILIYQNQEGNVKIDVRLEEENWKVRLIEEAFFNKMFEVKDI